MKVKPSHEQLHLLFHTLHIELIGYDKRIKFVQEKQTGKFSILAGVHAASPTLFSVCFAEQNSTIYSSPIYGRHNELWLAPHCDLHLGQ